MQRHLKNCSTEPAPFTSSVSRGIIIYMPWDYAKEAYEKQAAADPVWRLERVINYDFGEEKIDRALLEQYLPQLDIPEDRRAFLELLLWGKPF